MCQREFRLRNLYPVKTGNQRVAISIQSNKLEILSKIILNFRLIKHGIFHSLTPRAVVSLKHHQNAGLAFLLGNFSFLAEIIKTILKKVFRGVSGLAGD